MHGVLWNSTQGRERQRTGWNNPRKFSVYPQKSWRTGEVLEDGKRADIVSIHNKEKKLNPWICSQVSYLPIHGTNNQTISRKHLEENEDMSRTASTDLSGANNLKPFSFPSETRWQTLWVGKKQWVSCVPCPDFNKVFNTVLRDIVISNLEKPGWEETVILGQRTAGWQAVVREQLPMINCETVRGFWAGCSEICAAPECDAVFSLTGGLAESRGFFFGLQAGTSCRLGGEQVQNAK